MMTNVPSPASAPGFDSVPPQTAAQSPKRKSPWKWILASLGCFTLIIGICAICGYLTFVASSFDVSGPESLRFTSTTISGKGDSTVAIINISGVTEDFDTSGSILSEATSSADSISKMIDYAVDKENADAILIRLNTPGGTLTSAETICHKIKSVRQDGVYTMAWIETQGASGGYYIASCTDWIASRQEAITGSIGVIMQVIDITSFLESIGFRVRTITNTEAGLKSGDDIFTQGSDTDKIYTEILNQGYDQFIDAVADGRSGKAKSLSRSQIVALADGRVYTGAQAYENGLLDEIAYYSDAISSIKRYAGLPEDAKVVEIHKQAGFFDSLIYAVARKIIPIEVTIQHPGITLMAISNYN